MPCCLTNRISKCCSAVFDPWFKWTSLGVLLGFGIQWNRIYETYFSEDRSPVELMSGLLLIGFGLNFVVIGTTFVRTCGGFLRSRAIIAVIVRKFPIFKHVIQAPLKVLVGVWLSIAMVKAWSKLSRAAACLETDDCEGIFFGTLMNVRDKVCLNTHGEDDYKERGLFGAVVNEIRDSLFCLDIFYFFPFGLTFFTTTLVSAITLRVHLMKQQRFRDWKVMLAAAKVAEATAEAEVERNEKEPNTQNTPSPVVKPKKPKLDDPTHEVDVNTQPKPKMARID